MTIRIDGKACECEAGEYIMDVAKRNGITIPSLCSHPALEPGGCCRVCIVEIIDGKDTSIVVSCVYPVEKEIEVRTDTDRVKRQRGMTLAFLYKRAPGSEIIADMCNKYGAPQLDRLKAVTEPNKCILCGLCTRACSELGVGAIATIGRGPEKIVNTPYGDIATACIGCASCAHVCPTKAIAVADTNKTREIWRKVFEFEHCVSCGAVTGTKESVAWAVALSGGKPDGLCAECRKLATAQRIKDCIVFGDET